MVALFCQRFVRAWSCYEQTWLLSRLWEVHSPSVRCKGQPKERRKIKLITPAWYVIQWYPFPIQLPEIFAVSLWDFQHSWGNFDCTWQRILTDTCNSNRPVIMQLYWLYNVIYSWYRAYVCTLLSSVEHKALYNFPGQSKHQIEDIEDGVICKLWLLVLRLCGWVVNYHHNLASDWYNGLSAPQYLLCLGA